MNVGIAVVLGAILAIVGTVLVYIFVLPEGKAEQIHPFLVVVRDFFQLKYLLVEKIFHFFYILNTMACIGIGFFLLFAKIETWYSSSSTALFGLLYIVLGPIICRLIYELFMLTILLVKNTMEINAKLKGETGESLFTAKAPTVSDFTSEDKGE